MADYTAAIEALAQRKTEAAAADLKRLYARRGNAASRLEAVATGGRRLRPGRYRRDNRRGIAIQPGTRPGRGLLSRRWTVLKPLEAKSELGATFSILPDDSILVGGAHPLEGSLPCRVDARNRHQADGSASGSTHARVASQPWSRAHARRLASPQISWNVTATPPIWKRPHHAQVRRCWADHQLEWISRSTRMDTGISRRPRGRNSHGDLVDVQAGLLTRGHDADVRDAMPDQR